MPYSTRILPTAEAELDNTIAYLTAQGPQTARKFTNEFRKQLELLSSGVVDYGLSKLPELAALGYHACLVKSYVMLYFYEDNEIVIAHLFHQSRDYTHLVTNIGRP